MDDINVRTPLQFITFYELMKTCLLTKIGDQMFRIGEGEQMLPLIGQKAHNASYLPIPRHGWDSET
jgi:hypothetical protein